jgi:hypothetical protein
MANDSNNPFSISDMMQQSFEQSRRAMENCMDLFQKNLKTSPWFASSDLNKVIYGLESRCGLRLHAKAISSQGFFGVLADSI